MLNPQAQRILDILSGGSWHCPIDWKFGDGHGRRLTDINRHLALKGQKLAWDWCDCGRHTARIKKRKIVPLSADIKKPVLTFLGTTIPYA
jgi:hypothetical protein